MNPADDEVSVVHILCVAPEFQKKGIAARTMRAVIEMSRKSGKKAVHLDALKCNTPARRLYESLGFSPAAERNWHTENANLTILKDSLTFRKICSGRCGLALEARTSLRNTVSRRLVKNSPVDCFFYTR